ncbi:hypothetical protein JCM16303_003222 [Sporobolomyces ruberrimus]
MDQAGSYSIANFQGGPASSSKETRLDSSSYHSFPLPSNGAAATPPPLRPLPPAIALITVAQSLRSSALAILPLLSRPPQSPNSHVRYSKAWSDYYRMTTTSIVVLRAAVSAASVGEFRGGRIGLRANAMLAEQLADVYEGTEHVENVISEPESALSIGDEFAAKAALNGALAS